MFRLFDRSTDTNNSCFLSTLRGENDGSPAECDDPYPMTRGRGGGRWMASFGPTQTTNYKGVPCRQRRHPSLLKFSILGVFLIPLPQRSRKGSCPIYQILGTSVVMTAITAASGRANFTMEDTRSTYSTSSRAAPARGRNLQAQASSQSQTPAITVSSWQSATAW